MKIKYKRLTAQQVADGIAKFAILKAKLEALMTPPPRDTGAGKRKFFGLIGDHKGKTYRGTAAVDIYGGKAYRISYALDIKAGTGWQRVREGVYPKK